MTDLKQLKEALKPFCSEDSLIENCPMADHTTFKCGGNAALFAVPENEAALAAVIRIAQEQQVPFLLMGNGSNLLFSDSGYPGLVIRLGEGFSKIRVSGSTIYAGAAALLSAISNAAAANSLSGMEFACGIPGSLGGAIFMNAGAYGGEMKQIVSSVRTLDREGHFHILAAEELPLSYRHSVFEENGQILLEAELSLTPADKEEVLSRMRQLTLQRTAKQPLSYPSAGSFFKRPEGYFAGKLVQDAGLKGLTVGGAQISELHAGFVINKGGATATDVIDLMKIVQETVMSRFGVMLQPEVKIIGDY